MKNEYNVCGDKSLGYNWLEHKLNPDDKQLWGKKGFVFKTSDPHRYGVWVFSYALANSRAPCEDRKWTSGDQVLVYVDSIQVSKWIKALKLPKNPNEQLALADAFNSE